MRRIDALSVDRDRVAAFTGTLLASDEDPELQALVREAAAAVDAPIGAVSLVLERIQMFRAHHGMPPDLAAVPATDRDASFCQFVVRDRSTLAVTDAAHDERVPQEMVERYGVSAYLGVPLIVSGHALGTLCVLDVRARQFTAGQRAALEAIGERARARLTVLAGTEARKQRAHRGLRPAFAELRNLLMPLENNLATARVHAAELRMLGRLVAHVAQHGAVPAIGSLSGAISALDDLEAELADAMGLATDLSEVVLALQTAVVPSAGATGAVVAVAAALSLAGHQTKLVGGVRSRGDLDDRALRAAGTAVVTLVSAALVELARELYDRRATRGLELVVRRDADAMLVEITAPELGTGLLTETASLLERLASDESAIAVMPLPGGIAIRLST